jgi:hypothetical protein
MALGKGMEFEEVMAIWEVMVMAMLLLPVDHLHMVTHLN